MDQAMQQRSFTFRLRSSHAAVDRSTSSLLVEWLDDAGVWIPQVPSLTTPGFRLYLLSLLLCQHHDLVANAQERELPLLQVTGTFTVTTTADWIVQQVSGAFAMQLDPAAPEQERARASDEAIAFIAERMQLCPVSRNLTGSVDKRITLQLAPLS